MKYLKWAIPYNFNWSRKSSLKLLFLLPVILQISYQPIAAQEQQNVTPKSPALASTLAFVGTVGVVTLSTMTKDGRTRLILASGGIILGPVLGYAYMEDVRTGLRYAGTRVLILGATAGSMYLICAIDECDMGLFDSESSVSFGVAMTIFVFGVTATTIHNIVDIFKVHSRVEESRQRFSLSPAYFHHMNSLGIAAKWNL